MMTDPENLTKLARERAATTLNNARASLIKAAKKIADAAGIPDNINGLTAGEYLGRTSFVVTMERELVRAGEDVIAQQIMRQQFAATAPPASVDDLDKLVDGLPTQPRPPVKPEDPDKNTGDIIGAMDVTTIPGLTVQIHKALKQSGIHTLEDIEKFTDDALLKVNGIANPSLAKIRSAVAAARGTQVGGV